MRHSFVAAVLGALVSQSFALPAQTSHVVHEKRDAAKHLKWLKRDSVEADRVLPMRIGLKQSNLDNAMDLLMEVSHPESPRYGQHYTPEQVDELFAPSTDSHDSVKAWLVASGINEATISVSTNKAWLQFDARTKEVENLLKTKYHYYEHATGGHDHIGCDDYNVPAAVTGHIDYITPGVKVVAAHRQGLKKRAVAPHPVVQMQPMPAGVKSKLRANAAAVEFCGEVITPYCIKAMYGIPNGTLSNSGNALGIFEFGDFYAQEDLDDFYTMLASNIPNGTAPTLNSVRGAQAPVPPAQAGAESDLDFQISIPIIYPQKTILYQTDETQFQFSFGESARTGIFNSFLDAIDGSYCNYSADGEKGDDPNIDPVYNTTQCGVYRPANVISFSYGLNEVDFPQYYMKRQCNEFMKLGLRGVSIVFASGDTGAADPNGPCSGHYQNIFTPEYVDCPYVTSVGATTLPIGNLPGQQEISTTQFPSGGGFSNTFGKPQYQSDAVANYFKKHDPGYPYYSTLNDSLGPGLYNRIGRGYPDLAAVGQNGAIINGGVEFVAGGTSMSAPIVGSILTRINEERIAVGKGPVGFVNPTLYSNPSMFNDIISGDQAGGGCGTIGFSAAPGWDPVSGLGTPKYPEMLKVFMKLK